MKQSKHELGDNSDNSQRNNPNANQFPDPVSEKQTDIGREGSKLKLYIFDDGWTQEEANAFGLNESGFSKKPKVRSSERVDFSDFCEVNGKNTLVKLGKITHSIEGRNQNTFHTKTGNITVNNTDGFWDNPKGDILYTVTGEIANFKLSENGNTIAWKNRILTIAQVISDDSGNSKEEDLGTFLINGVSTNTTNNTASLKIIGLEKPFMEANAEEVKDGNKWFQDKTIKFLVKELVKELRRDINISDQEVLKQGDRVEVSTLETFDGRQVFSSLGSVNVKGVEYLVHSIDYSVILDTTLKVNTSQGSNQILVENDTADEAFWGLSRPLRIEDYLIISDGVSEERVFITEDVTPANNNLLKITSLKNSYNSGARILRFVLFCGISEKNDGSKNFITTYDSGRKSFALKTDGSLQLIGYRNDEAIPQANSSLQAPPRKISFVKVSLDSNDKPIYYLYVYCYNSDNRTINKKSFIYLFHMTDTTEVWDDNKIIKSEEGVLPGGLDGSVEGIYGASSGEKLIEELLPLGSTHTLYDQATIRQEEVKHGSLGKGLFAVGDTLLGGAINTAAHNLVTTVVRTKRAVPRTENGLVKDLAPAKLVIEVGIDIVASGPGGTRDVTINEGIATTKVGNLLLQHGIFRVTEILSGTQVRVIEVDSTTNNSLSTGLCHIVDKFFEDLFLYIAVPLRRSINQDHGKPDYKLPDNASIKIFSKNKAQLFSVQITSQNPVMQGNTVPSGFEFTGATPKTANKHYSRCIRNDGTRDGTDFIDGLVEEGSFALQDQLFSVPLPVGSTKYGYYRIAIDINNPLIFQEVVKGSTIIISNENGKFNVQSSGNNLAVPFKQNPKLETIEGDAVAVEDALIVDPNKDIDNKRSKDNFFEKQNQHSSYNSKEVIKDPKQELEDDSMFSVLNQKIPLRLEKNEELHIPTQTPIDKFEYRNMFGQGVRLMPSFMSQQTDLMFGYKAFDYLQFPTIMLMIEYDDNFTDSLTPLAEQFSKTSQVGADLGMLEGNLRNLGVINPNNVELLGYWNLENTNKQILIEEDNTSGGQKDYFEYRSGSLYELELASNTGDFQVDEDVIVIRDPSSVYKDKNEVIGIVDGWDSTKKILTIRPTPVFLSGLIDDFDNSGTRFIGSSGNHLKGVLSGGLGVWKDSRDIGGSAISITTDEAFATTNIIEGSLVEIASTSGGAYSFIGRVTQKGETFDSKSEYIIFTQDNIDLKNATTSWFIRKLDDSGNHELITKIDTLNGKVSGIDTFIKDFQIHGSIGELLVSPTFDAYGARNAFYKGFSHRQSTKTNTQEILKTLSSSTLAKNYQYRGIDAGWIGNSSDPDNRFGFNNLFGSPDKLIGGFSRGSLADVLGTYYNRSWCNPLCNPGIVYGNRKENQELYVNGNIISVISDNQSGFHTTVKHNLHHSYIYSGNPETSKDKQFTFEYNVPLGTQQSNNDNPYLKTFASEKFIFRYIRQFHNFPDKSGRYIPLNENQDIGTNIFPVGTLLFRGVDESDSMCTNEFFQFLGRPEIDFGKEKEGELPFFQGDSSIPLNTWSSNTYKLSERERVSTDSQRKNLSTTLFPSFKVKKLEGHWADDNSSDKRYSVESKYYLNFRKYRTVKRGPGKIFITTFCLPIKYSPPLQEENGARADSITNVELGHINPLTNGEGRLTNYKFRGHMFPNNLMVIGGGTTLSPYFNSPVTLTNIIYNTFDFGNGGPGIDDVTLHPTFFRTTIAADRYPQLYSSGLSQLNYNPFSVLNYPFYFSGRETFLGTLLSTKRFLEDGDAGDDEPGKQYSNKTLNTWYYRGGLITRRLSPHRFNEITSYTSDLVPSRNNMISHMWDNTDSKVPSSIYGSDFKDKNLYHSGFLDFIGRFSSGYEAYNLADEDRDAIFQQLLAFDLYGQTSVQKGVPNETQTPQVNMKTVDSLRFLMAGGLSGIEQDITQSEEYKKLDSRFQDQLVDLWKDPIVGNQSCLKFFTKDLITNKIIKRYVALGTVDNENDTPEIPDNQGNTSLQHSETIKFDKKGADNTNIGGDDYVLGPSWRDKLNVGAVQAGNPPIGISHGWQAGLLGWWGENVYKHHGGLVGLLGGDTIPQIGVSGFFGESDPFSMRMLYDGYINYDYVSAEKSSSEIDTYYRNLDNGGYYSQIRFFGGATGEGRAYVLKVKPWSGLIKNKWFIGDKREFEVMFVTEGNLFASSQFSAHSGFKASNDAFVFAEGEKSKPSAFAENPNANIHRQEDRALNSKFTYGKIDNQRFGAGPQTYFDSVFAISRLPAADQWKYNNCFGIIGFIPRLGDWGWYPHLDFKLSDRIDQFMNNVNLDAYKISRLKIHRIITNEMPIISYPQTVPSTETNFLEKRSNINYPRYLPCLTYYWKTTSVEQDFQKFGKNSGIFIAGKFGQNTLGLEPIDTFRIVSTEDSNNEYRRSFVDEIDPIGLEPIDKSNSNSWMDLAPKWWLDNAMPEYKKLAFYNFGFKDGDTGVQQIDGFTLSSSYGDSYEDGSLSKSGVLSGIANSFDNNKMNTYFRGGPTVGVSAGAITLQGKAIDEDQIEIKGSLQISLLRTLFDVTQAENNNLVTFPLNDSFILLKQNTTDFSFTLSSISQVQPIDRIDILIETAIVRLKNKVLTVGQDQSLTKYVESQLTNLEDIAFIPTLNRNKLFINIDINSGSNFISRDIDVLDRDSLPPPDFSNLVLKFIYSSKSLALKLAKSVLQGSFFTATVPSGFSDSLNLWSIIREHGFRHLQLDTFGGIDDNATAILITRPSDSSFNLAGNFVPVDGFAFNNGTSVLQLMSFFNLDKVSTSPSFISKPVKFTIAGTERVNIGSEEGFVHLGNTQNITDSETMWKLSKVRLNNPIEGYFLNIDSNTIFKYLHTGTLIPTPDFPNLKFFDNFNLIGDGTPIIPAEKSASDFIPVTLPLNELFGFSNSLANSVNVNDPVPGRYVLWQLSKEFSGIIDVADFSTLKVWDVLKFFAELTDSVHGFDESGSYFFLPRPIVTPNTLVENTFDNIDNNNIISIKKQLDYNNIVNDISMIPYKILRSLPEVEFIPNGFLEERDIPFLFTEQESISIQQQAKNQNVELIAIQKDDVISRIELTCRDTDYNRNFQEDLEGRGFGARFSYRVVKEVVKLRLVKALQITETQMTVNKIPTERGISVIKINDIIIMGGEERKVSAIDETNRTISFVAIESGSNNFNNNFEFSFDVLILSGTNDSQQGFGIQEINSQDFEFAYSPKTFFVEIGDWLYDLGQVRPRGVVTSFFVFESGKNKTMFLNSTINFPNAPGFVVAGGQLFKYIAKGINFLLITDDTSITVRKTVIFAGDTVLPILVRDETKHKKTDQLGVDEIGQTCLSEEHLFNPNEDGFVFKDENGKPITALEFYDKNAASINLGQPEDSSLDYENNYVSGEDLRIRNRTSVFLKVNFNGTRFKTGDVIDIDAKGPRLIKSEALRIQQNDLISIRKYGKKSVASTNNRFISLELVKDKTKIIISKNKDPKYLLQLATTSEGTIGLLNTLQVVHNKMFAGHTNNTVKGFVKKISYDLNTGQKILTIETEPF